MSSLLDRAGEGFKEQVKARAVKEFMTGDYPASAFSTHWRQICWFWRVEVWLCRYFGFERCRRIAGITEDRVRACLDSTTRPSRESVLSVVKPEGSQDG